MSKSQSSSFGWIVTASGTGINLALGALYTWSIFKGGLESQYGLTAAQSALPYTIACLVFAFFMVPAGRMLDRFGPRLVATIGGVLVGIGFIISSRATEAHPMAFLIIGFGILAGAGIGFGYASAAPAAIKWFPPEKKGLIVGIVVGGFGLASVYVAPLTRHLIGIYGINQTFFVLGIAFLIIIIALAQFLKNPPAGYKPAAMGKAKKSGAAAPAKVQRDYAWNEMIKTPQFWMIWLMFAFSAGAGLMVISFASSLARGEFAQYGFLLVALLAIGNASGRIIAGSMSDTLGRTKTMLIVFVLQAIVLVIMAQFYNQLIVAVVGVFLVGFNYGACLSVFPSITADFYGMKNLGVNYGLVFTSWGIGSIMAVAAGIIRDRTDSYMGSLIMAAVLLIVAAGITFLVKTPDEKAEAPAASPAKAK